MSIELFSDTALSTNQVQEAVDAIPNEQYVLVGTPTLDTLLLRFASQPRRENWPEDVRISFGRSISLAMHSGAEQERIEFVRHVEHCLRRLGHRCQFEEE